MHVKKIEDIPSNPVDMEGAENVRMRLLLSEKEGAPNFRMRLFEVEVGGCSPYHTHDYDHEVLILDGKGELIAKNKSYSGSQQRRPHPYMAQYLRSLWALCGELFLLSGP